MSYLRKKPDRTKEVSERERMRERERGRERETHVIVV